MNQYSIHNQPNFPSFNQRKTFSQNNSYLNGKQTTQKNQINEKDFELKNSQSYYSGQLEIQEVTEQFLFQNPSPIMKNQFNSVYVTKQHEEQSKKANINLKKYSFNDSESNLNVQIYDKSVKSSQYQQDLNVAERMKMIFPHQKLSDDFYAKIMKIQLLNQKIIQAKQSHKEFLVWYQNQKNSFWKYFTLSIQTFKGQVSQMLLSKQNIINSKQKQQTPLSSSITKQKSWQIQKKLLKQQIQQRYEYRIQQLQKELKQCKSKILHNVITSNHQNQKIQEELNILRVRLFQKNKLIQELEIQNQRLNQYIFDVQQKIQGIDIIVEEKLRLKIAQYEIINKKIQPIEQSSQKLINQNSFHASSTSNFKSQQFDLNQKFNQLHLQADKIKHQNQQLKNKLLALQKNSSQVGQSVQFQKILKFRQQQVQKNEQEIKIEWNQIDRIHDQFTKRDQKLKIAQQNISKDNEQLRLKQNELLKWQSELYEKQSELISKQNEIKMQFQQFQREKENQKSNKYNYFNHYNNQLLVNKNKPQSNGYIKKSFIDQQQDYTVSFNSNNYNRENFNNNSINQKYQKVYRQNQDRSYQNQPHSRKKINELINKPISNHRQSEKIHIKKDYRQKQQQKVTNSSHSVRVVNNLSHNFALPPSINSIKGHQRSRSNSRSIDKSFTLKNGFHNNYTNSRTPKNRQQIYQSKQSPNLDGLGSKLQKLRDEIKKQINSIK